MDNETCVFYVNGKLNTCKVLAEKKCDGKNYCCSFYKTAEKFQSDRDRAILLNREHRNCRDCKYMKISCRLSTENGGENYENKAEP